MKPPPPRSTLFPYPTLFRSVRECRQLQRPAQALGQPLQQMGLLRGLHLDRRSEEQTSELQSPCNLVCRLLLEKKIKMRLATYISHTLYNSAYLRLQITALLT